MNTADTNDATFPVHQAKATIRQLVTEMIDSGRTAEDVCRSHPDLLNDVRRLWQRARGVQDEVEALFPSSDPWGGSETALQPDDSLPQISGYEIESIVGRGGMGVVYKARQLSLNRTVAIKVPLAGVFASASERQRHMREAQAIAALGHPNIITVHDVGESGGRPYFTMEFIDGQQLGARLANTPQPARDAASLLATLADAIHCAHQAGIVHRDLKPANVLLAPDGTPRITDFGLARHFGGDATLTVAGFQFGTPSYMSPEQARGQPEEQSSAVDVYALGAILYELLTGRPPFRGESAVETLRQVLEEEPAPPSRLNPSTPRDLETICVTCLRKDPRRRYSSANALAEDLRRFLRGEPIQARPVGSIERLYRWGRRRPASAALIAVGVIAVIAGLAIGFWVQHIQNARTAEVALRAGRARQAVETAVGLANDLRANGRWVEARHVLDDAYSRLPEAKSDELAEVLNRADQHLTAANELDDIRRRYPDTSDTGFNYRPAAEAYGRVFTRLGLGPDVPLDVAANAVSNSPIHGELLTALDNAAFVARVIERRAELDRILAIARTADPDPWRDRFRQAAAWFDRAALLSLCEDAKFSTEPPAPHQIVIVGVLLSGLGANDKAIDILRAAHRLNPVDFWVNLELGNALVRAGRAADAAHYYRACVTIQPKNAGAWVSLAGQLNFSGAREEALVAVRKATEMNPHLLVAWSNYISYLRGSQRFDEAEAALSQAIEANPKRRDSLGGLLVGIRWDRARYLASRGEWHGALSEYQAVLPNAPADGEFWFEVAAVSLLAGERNIYERIRAAMLKCEQLGSLRPFLVARAVTLIPAPIDQVEAAAALSESELRGNSPIFWSLRQRGAMLCRTGREADAIPLFEQGIASAPAKGRAVLNWLWLAIAHHHLGHAEESARWHATAVAWLDTLDNGMPDNASALGFHLHDWLEAQVLRQEAALLLSIGE